MKRVMTILQPLYKAFYSPACYQQVTHRWRLKTFGYLLLLAGLLAASLIPSSYRNLSHFLTADISVWAKQFPDLTIEQGIAQTPENKPYFIYTGKANKLFAIIDTGGHYTALKATPAILLLTKTTIFYQTKDRVQQYPLANLGSLQVAQAEIIQFLSLLKNWLLLGFTLILVLGYYGLILIEALIAALLGLIIVHFQKLKLNYDELLRLWIVARTPASLLLVAAHLGSMSLPYTFILLISIGFFGFALKANQVALNV